jgi:poly(A) polymerase
VGLLHTIKNFFGPKANTTNNNKTHFAHGEDFAINTRSISHNVKKVTQRLTETRYEAYLVGGGVRDLLLHKKPKDFDVATNATPEQVRKQFRNCRIIGRRFKLAHVYFKDEIIEVATFRAAHHSKKSETHLSDHGMILRDNNYGDLEEDAWRRDFTINALYYDLQNDIIVDYTGGLDDITARHIRIIGDAGQRYREDPVRMLRALRFAAKLDFTIEPHTEAPLAELKNLLWNIPPARLFEEVLKLFFTGHAYQAYQVLSKYDFLGLLFPQTDQCLKQDPQFKTLLEQALQNTDQRIAQDLSINPAFLLAVFLWGPFQTELKEQQKHEKKIFIALQNASEIIIRKQLETIAIPRRFTQIIKEIWDLQYRLPKRHGKRALQTLSLPRFRAAYDFLLLRASIDAKWQELANWWTEFQKVDADEQEAMIKSLMPKTSRTRTPKQKNQP